jgi:uncharacterized protein YndB with AHSA1/START domain
MSKYKKTVDENRLTLTIERRFRAPKDQVWTYFTNREWIEQWWGPEHFPTTIKIFDFRVGGFWHYHMTGPDGTKYWNLAEYKAIREGIALEYDDYFSDETGAKSSTLPVTRVHIEFRADGAETIVVSTLKFNSLADLRKLIDMGFEHGFASQCDKLDKLLAGGQGGPPRIVVETTVRAPIADVWRAYTTPGDIIKWNAASDDWHTPHASVDLRIGGTFRSRMEAKDGSAGFDFEGTYTNIVEHRLIEYAFGDRTARVDFIPGPTGVKVRVIFDSDTVYSVDQQRAGWQAILDNFKTYVESRA